MVMNQDPFSWHKPFPLFPNLEFNLVACTQQQVAAIIRKLSSLTSKKYSPVHVRIMRMSVLCGLSQCPQLLRVVALGDGKSTIAGIGGRS